MISILNHFQVALNLFQFSCRWYSIENRRISSCFRTTVSYRYWVYKRNSSTIVDVRTVVFRWCFSLPWTSRREISFLIKNYGKLKSHMDLILRCLLHGLLSLCRLVIYCRHHFRQKISRFFVAKQRLISSSIASSSL